MIVVTGWKDGGLLTPTTKVDQLAGDDDNLANRLTLEQRSDALLAPGGGLDGARRRPRPERRPGPGPCH